MDQSLTTKDPFADPNANKSPPPTPYSQPPSTSKVTILSPSHLRSEAPVDPFLDHLSISSRTNGYFEPPFTRSAHGIPREETFQSTTESLGGITASGVDSASEYEIAYKYTESDLDDLMAQLDLSSASQDHTQPDLGKGDQGFSRGLHGLSHFQPEEHMQPDPFNTSHDFEQDNHATPSIVRRPIRILSENQYPSLGLPENRPNPSNKTTNTPHDTKQTSNTLTNHKDHRSVNDVAGLPSGHFSSSVTEETQRGSPLVQNNTLFTSQNSGTYTNLRTLAGGYNPQDNWSIYSLNRDVRLHEAAKQQDVLLAQERAHDLSMRIPFPATPTLRPSPIALRVAAQLIRDSPAGQLPIGAQAVLHSKSFWAGLSIAEVGLISMSAAITTIVHAGTIYQDEPAGGTGGIFWLTISIVALLGGGTVAGVAFIRKMGYCVNLQPLLGLGEVRFVDQLSRREQAVVRTPELGMLPNSVETFASQASIPKQRLGGGLYTSQGRFTHTTLNTENTEWAELYMTPEEIRERITDRNLNSQQSTPRGETGTEDRPTGKRPSLQESNPVAPEPLMPVSPLVENMPETPNPFQCFPEPPTPYHQRGKGFKDVGSKEYMTGTLNSADARVEVEYWSPLENLTRDINSERVRNMPMEDRYNYITEQRIRSEERARKLRESLGYPSVQSVRSRRNSDGQRPRIISDEKHGSPGGPSDKRFLAEAQQAKFLDQEGIEMIDLDFANAIRSSRATTYLNDDFHRRRTSGGSVDQMKINIASKKNGFTELNGRSVGTMVREKIDKLREQSEKSQNQK
jgi:hypothetical protein